VVPLDFSAAATKLSEHGYKQTRQRLAVLGVLSEAERGLTATEVHARARTRCRVLGLPTVYRTLEVLEESGLVRRIHTAGGCERFAAVSLFNSHHIVCVSCGKVAEFTGCNVGELVPAAARQTGFHVEGHFLELLGTCGTCRLTTSDEVHHLEGTCACAH
jgi:Fur family transcriptional regulator, ferric uptake regulator